ncbi:MAG: 16S rRNA (cytosine(1402)-N(4))-methyltransferase RsmH [Thermoanaerobaculia bacterium]
MADAQHRSVLLEETLHWLDPERGGIFVDCTLGLGGHAHALLSRYPDARLVGIDRDPRALALARERLAEFGGRAQFVEGNFRDLEAIWAERRENAGELASPAGIYADLGMSSLQLDSAERGFSFQREGPLDMRMGTSGETAFDLVNFSTEENLEEIFREYGEEPESRRVARAVVEERQSTPIDTTVALANVVRRAKRRGRDGGERLDPATRVFQALRLAVNEELQAADELLDQAVRMLNPEGRLVIISFHSLEDRIVKNRFRNMARGEVDPTTGRTHSETRVLEVLTKRPVRPGEAEVQFNPRSRSARLRAARRI